MSSDTNTSKDPLAETMPMWSPRNASGTSFPSKESFKTKDDTFVDKGAEGAKKYLDAKGRRDRSMETTVSHNRIIEDKPMIRETSPGVVAETFLQALVSGNRKVLYRLSDGEARRRIVADFEQGFSIVNESNFIKMDCEFSRIKLLRAQQPHSQAHEYRLKLFFRDPAGHIKSTFMTLMVQKSRGVFRVVGF